MTTTEEIKTLSRDHHLCREGFLLKHEQEINAFDPWFLDPDAILIAQVDAARSWIARFVRRRTINRAARCSMLRLMAQTETSTEISIGAFVTACLLEQIELKQTAPDERDGYTSLSFKRVS